MEKPSITAMQRPILILLPSLNRPNSLSECVSSYVANGTGLADILILTGSGGVGTVYNSVSHELLTRYEIIGMSGDDVRMRTPLWDEIVCQHLKGKVGLVYGRDGIKDKLLCTHPFISSKIIAALGFVQHPSLRHFYGDDFWHNLLEPMGALYYVPEIYNEHLHWTSGRSPKDQTYAAAEAHCPNDTAAWESLQTELPALRERVKSIL